jgi:hypothetical protein
MTMANKIVAGLTTAGLMASGGVAAVVVTSPGLAVAQDDAVEAPQLPGPGMRPGGPFAELLDEGVLDEAEVETVRQVLQELHDAARQENGLDDSRRVRRPFRAGYRLHELLEDGIIDSDEISELPADSPILDPDGPFVPYLEDGELSTDEMDELKGLREAEMEERRTERDAAVADALAAMVADGTLTTGQVDAITAALETAREQRPHPVRNRMRAGWQIAELLEDGVIDAAELAELPEGHPLADPDGPAAAYLDDGQLTADELAEMRSQFRPGPAADNEV